MRIAVLVPDRDPNPWYRALLPMEMLGQLRGHTIATAEVTGLDTIPDFEELATFDVVYIWRMYYLPLRRLAAALQRRGVAVIWDNDVDMFAVPRSAVAYRWFGGLRGQREWREMQRMIRQVDAVATTTPALADKYRPIGNGHVYVIESYLPGTFPRARAAHRSRLVVGWLGTNEHLEDLRRLRIAETLTRVLDFRPNVDVVSVGLSLPLRTARYRELRPRTMEERHELLGTIHVGLAPLADTAYNRAETTLQIKEYAAFGVPWLASPVGAHAALGPAQGGWLVEDDAWEQRLTQLLTDAAVRDDLSRAGHAWAQQQTIEHHVDEWERMLVETVQRIRSPRSQPATA
jgi:glycosyltransferase involved in cell wall biosynthesis